MSNMIQTQDEISSTHDSPIAGSSNVFEVLFKTLTLTFIIIMSYKGNKYMFNFLERNKTHAETEWNSIQRVDEVSGIQHTCISDSLISPSSGLVSNKVHITFSSVKYKYMRV